MIAAFLRWLASRDYSQQQWNAQLAKVLNDDPLPPPRHRYDGDPMRHVLVQPQEKA